MDDDIVFRRCRSEEAAEVVALWRAAGATVSVTDTPADVARAAGRGDTCFVVAERGGALVGTIIGGFDGWRGNVYRLAVHPDCRRRGVARALVAEVMRWFEARGVRRITALVERDHPDAVAFWAGVGYADDRRIARYVKTIPGGPANDHD